MSSSPTLASVADRRTLWAAAVEAITGLRELLWQVPNGHLGDVLGELDQLAALAAGARVAVVAEAETRGEIAASQAGSVTGWVAGHAPSLATGGGGGQVAKLVHDTRTMELAPVRDAVIDGTVPTGVALTVITEFRKLRHRLQDAAAPTVLQGLLTMGASDGSRGVRSLRPALLATYGLDGEFQHDTDTAAGLISLSRPVGDDLAGYTYQLTLDPVGSATLEAAIGPLSRPVPGPDGSRDTRSVQLWRGQALIEVIHRATAAGEQPPTGVKTTLIVTMNYDDLKNQVGAATVLGTPAGGTLLAPDTVRRLACDADLIPAVLGTKSQLLDLGHATRLATPAQLLALWLRDKHCTFPGCATPAHWCDAHHLTHWADGGPTTLTNLGLLCGRHHTIVHRDHLHGHYDPDTNSIHWDTTPGSYRAGAPPGTRPPTQSWAPPRPAECDTWPDSADSTTSTRGQSPLSATVLLEGDDDPWQDGAGWADPGVHWSVQQAMPLPPDDDPWPHSA